MTIPEDPNLGWQTSTVKDGRPSDILQPDEATVRQFFQTFHILAARAFEGVDQPSHVQLVCIHPKGGAPVTMPFRIGDVDEMEKLALAYAASAHNVYIEGRTVKETVRGRGRIENTRGVFAFVIDSDADKGKAGHLSIEPTITIETSPGNCQCWIFLDHAISAEEATRVGAAIREATGADSATGVITQPYRVPGTPNFPDAKKQSRGRVTTQTRIVTIGGPVRSLDELVRAFPPPETTANSRYPCPTPYGFVVPRLSLVLSILTTSFQTTSNRSAVQTPRPT